MRFGKTLRNSIYPPWKGKYVDYDKLKRLLREDEDEAGSGGDQSSSDEREWTERDVENFTIELINVQLEKVNQFHASKLEELRQRTTACGLKLDELAESPPNEGETKRSGVSEEDRTKKLRDALADLDAISKDVKELEKYSRLNYTGFLKACKKHDRRTEHYKIKHVLLVRLAMLPFNREDYSPLLFRLEAMYTFVRGNLEEGENIHNPFSGVHGHEGGFVSHKFWVHTDNLMELKLVILRHLPRLVFAPHGAKFAAKQQENPKVNSIYFDNRKHELYANKVDDIPHASSLRLRWYGTLAETDEVYFERRAMRDTGISDTQRLPIEPQHVQELLQGSYDVEEDENVANAKVIRSFIEDFNLQPVLRANYTREAFEIPGDDRVRVSLDTDLVLIREDALSKSAPCRNPDDWHRKEIDDSEVTEHPFSNIRKNEISRFPHGILEVKVKAGRKFSWAEDLMASHLVTPAPKFSKFVHGTSVLMDDRVATLPFWLPQLETDIRRDPHEAYEEEQKQKEKRALDEIAVGSLTMKRPSPFLKDQASPYGSSPAQGPSSPRRPRMPEQPPTGADTTDLASRTSALRRLDEIESEPKVINIDRDTHDDELTLPDYLKPTRIASLLPSRKITNLMRESRSRRRASRTDLPPNVVRPSLWLKDMGPVNVEPKVWLANQRTFIKWQHVAIWLASLGLALFNAAEGASAPGGQNGMVLARALGLFYFIVAAVTSIWGWAMYQRRQRLIAKRSGEDMNDMRGPVTVAVLLVAGLCINFAVRYNGYASHHYAQPSRNDTLPEVYVGEL